jgi:hypothetical protein
LDHLADAVSLTRRFVLVLVLVVVLESGHTERWSVGVLEYCAQSEKHPPWRIGDAEGAKRLPRSISGLIDYSLADTLGPLS